MILDKRLMLKKLELKLMVNGLIYKNGVLVLWLVVEVNNIFKECAFLLKTEVVLVLVLPLKKDLATLNLAPI